jgi:hypothetical protein
MSEKSVAQVAQERGVNRRTVIGWINRGYVTARKKGYGRTSPWLIVSVAEQVTATSRPRPTSPPITSRYREPVDQKPAPAADGEMIYVLGQRYTPEEWELAKAMAQAQGTRSAYELPEPEPPYEKEEPVYVPLDGLYPGDDHAPDDFSQDG